MTDVRGRARGFTLIEIAVVMLLLVIVLGMIGLQLGGDDTRAGEQESERLMLLLQAAQQEAILQGDILGVDINAEGYEFVRLDEENKFRPLKDDVLYPRQLPQNVTIQSVELEGAAEEQSLIIVWPTGELTAFNLTVVQGKAVWRVEGAVNGEVRFARTS